MSEPSVQHPPGRGMPAGGLAPGTPEHRVELRYPAEVVAVAERWCDLVFSAVAAGDEPFGTVGHEWLRRAAESAPPPGGTD